MVARDIRLLEEVGGRLHVAHVSCADTIPLIREAKARGLRITAEVTPHHLCLTDRLLEGDPELDLAPAHPCTKVNPPLRSQEDVTALVEALADGTIDAVATDHAPHTAADKDQPYASAAFGFSALETALPLLLDRVRDGRIALPVLVERLTTGPARVFGLSSSLRPGSSAHVCIFDPNEEWEVLPNSLRSRGKNTPLLNRRLRGKVRWTIVAGRVVHGFSAS
jgi:dihydroorotase